MSSWAQLAKLTASDGKAGDDLGISIAVSGNTVVVGARSVAIGSNEQQGAAYVFVKAAGGWKTMRQIAKLTASDGASYDYFGSSVAISGNTILVGATGWPAGSQQGAAYVFTKPSKGWKNMTETARLTSTDVGNNNYFGSSVSIGGDTAVVGAPFVTVGNNQFQGAAYVFVKPAKGWQTTSQPNATLTSSNGRSGDGFGDSVSMLGNAIVAGAYNANAYRGEAYVFAKPSSGWTSTTETARLAASDGQQNDGFGSSVSFSGNAIFVGAVCAPAQGGNCGPGVAYVFVKPPSGWADMTQTARLSASDGAAFDRFGASVSISGSTAVVGAPSATIGSNTWQGAAYVFMKPKSGWITTSKFNAKLKALRGAADDLFASSVSASGTTVMAGAPGATVGSNHGQGAGYVFARK